MRVKNLHDYRSKKWTSGSLQEFIPNQSPCNSGVFAIEDVQRMSLIDIHFGNNDRHHENILKSQHGGRLELDEINSVFHYKIRTKVLKTGVANKYVPTDIARLMVKAYDDKKENSD
ncbi:unnamed protein product [Microthlaspi erraticum]|uniref:1-phosphatidylinositol 4-kinase n=1 Tax=Microthlaspi erraticum TaxID=1685480 RepID=A0A6D2KB23_9BRAS|nr:unnamed protein product [Microthlaspi erraticum]